MYRGLFSSALSSHWRREVLRTSLWFVPSLEVVAAIGLFIGTLAATTSRDGTNHRLVRSTSRRQCDESADEKRLRYMAGSPSVIHGRPDFPAYPVIANYYAACRLSVVAPLLPG